MKTDKELYHAVNLLWNAVQTISHKVKDLRTSDKDYIIETDLLESYKALTRYRELLKENRG